jgi:pantoate kinase
MVMTVVTASAVSTAKAFCPGHITGFLAKASDLTCSKNEDARDKRSYLYMGSMGAGLAIAIGLSSAVKVFEKDNYSQTTYDVYINGSNRNINFEVTKSVVEEYIRLLGEKSYHIRIEHETSVPIGYGLSSSGAAALSLSYALNSALNVELSLEQAAQIAHCSEIECRTGLGSVLAQYVGGFELRSALGAPGVGIAYRIPCPSSRQDLKVVILCLSPVSTKKFLTHHIRSLNGFGEKMLERLKITRNINDFLDMSFEFADTLGLISGRSRILVSKLKSRGFGCSVALFGNTIFSIVKSSDVSDVVKCLKGSGGKLLICDIDQQGARLIDK